MRHSRLPMTACFPWSKGGRRRAGLYRRFRPRGVSPAAGHEVTYTSPGGNWAAGESPAIETGTWRIESGEHRPRSVRRTNGRSPGSGPADSGFRNADCSTHLRRSRDAYDAVPVSAPPGPNQRGSRLRRPPLAGSKVVVGVGLVGGVAAGPVVREYAGPVDRGGWPAMAAAGWR